MKLWGRLLILDFLNRYFLFYSVLLFSDPLIFFLFILFCSCSFFFQVFPYSQQTLHNIVETAPETWEGGMYDEKSDVFSFSIILWRLFGSRAQYEPTGVVEGARGEAKNNKQMNDENDEEFDYLKVDRKHVPPPKQRDMIRKVCISFFFPNLFLFFFFSLCFLLFLIVFSFSSF